MIISEKHPRLVALLILHEGLRLSPYLCTAGKLTIGVGHNLTAKPINGIGPLTRITRERALQILDSDLKETIAEVKKALPWVSLLNEPRQAVLVDMAFNLGVKGLKGFKKFLLALQDDDFSKDDDHMFDSKWAMQVGDGRGRRFDRADRLAKMVRTGLWP